MTFLGSNANPTDDNAKIDNSNNNNELTASGSEFEIINNDAESDIVYPVPTEDTIASSRHSESELTQSALEEANNNRFNSNELAVAQNSLEIDLFDENVSTDKRLTKFMQINTECMQDILYQLQELKEGYKTQSEKIKSLTKELGSARASYEKQAEEVKSHYEKNLEQIKEEKGGLESKVTNLQESEDKLKSQIADLQRLEAALTTKLSSVETSNKDLEEKAAGLEQEKNALNEKISNARRKEVELDVQINSLQQSRDKLRAKRDDLKKAQLNAETKIHKLEEERKNVELKAVELEKENEGAKEEAEKYRKLSDNLCSQITVLEDDKKSINLMLKDAMAELGNTEYKLRNFVDAAYKENTKYMQKYKHIKVPPISEKFRTLKVYPLNTFERDKFIEQIEKSGSKWSVSSVLGYWHSFTKGVANTSLYYGWRTALFGLVGGSMAATSTAVPSAAAATAAAGAAPTAAAAAAMPASFSVVAGTGVFLTSVAPIMFSSALAIYTINKAFKTKHDDLELDKIKSGDEDYIYSLTKDEVYKSIMHELENKLIMPLEQLLSEVEPIAEHKNDQYIGKAIIAASILGICEYNNQLTESSNNNEHDDIFSEGISHFRAICSKLLNCEKVDTIGSTLREHTGNIQVNAILFNMILDVIGISLVRSLISCPDIDKISASQQDNSLTSKSIAAHASAKEFPNIMS